MAIENKVAVITGIGSEIARTFAADGDDASCITGQVINVSDGVVMH